MSKRLQLPKGDEMREKIEAELEQRKQEMTDLQAEMNDLATRYNRGVELLRLKEGAMQQLQMLLGEEAGDEPA